MPRGCIHASLSILAAGFVLAVMTSGVDAAELPKSKAEPVKKQTVPPKTPQQFNPDPGGVPTYKAPAPTPKPLAQPPEPGKEEPKPTPVLESPAAATLPSGSPFDIGLPDTPSPLIPDGLPTPELAGRPSLFSDDFLYLPRFDNEEIPNKLKLPRRGVHSQTPQSNIFTYREYPMGQEGLGVLPYSEAMANRWLIPYPHWKRYMDPSIETPYDDGRETIRLWHPYKQSKLKGDAPVIGQDIFLNITAKNFSLFEYRRLPVPSGISAVTPNSSEFFGRGEQYFISNDSSIAIDFFKGETSFKPVDWLLRFNVVRNDNWIWVREQGLLDPDPRGVNRSSGSNPDTKDIGAIQPNGSSVNPKGGGLDTKTGTVATIDKVVNPGDLFNYIYPQLKPAGGSDKFVEVDPLTNEPKDGKKQKSNPDHEKDFKKTRNTYRHRDFIALQEAFFEYHLGDRSQNYDFWTSRVGIQPFVSDFRGFIFNDTNLGLRLFGNADNNRLQYNVAYFNMREKDTYSGLNSFDSRDQQVLIANLYRQDFLTPGYTTQLSFHMNWDDGQTHYDKNDFLVRPAQLGDFSTEHDVRVGYLGWAGDGHIGRLNINHAFYWALGEDELNGLAGQRVDVNAQMAALELSYDRDWIRFKLSGFWASGDSDPLDDRATGFDSILDQPSFVGGPFSWYAHEGINLAGTAVNLKSNDSLLPNLRSSKIEGQSNFVNPGVKILGVGFDADVTPKLRAFFNANYIWFDQTAPLERALQTNKVSDRLGLDLSLGLKYRPLLTENIVIGAGIGFFIPDEGYKDIYRRSSAPVDNFGPQDEAGEADAYLWNAIVTVSFTF